VICAAVEILRVRARSSAMSEIDVIAGLDAMAKPRFDLVRGGVGVGDAGGGAGSFPDGVYGSRKQWK
jgi:hypothetical protein